MRSPALITLFGVGYDAIAAAGFRQIHCLVSEIQQLGGIVIARSARSHSHTYCHLDIGRRNWEWFGRYLPAQSLRNLKSTRHVGFHKSDPEFFAAQPTK